ncbi:hypothetical protein D3C85_1676050 [compost metagenome]
MQYRATGKVPAQTQQPDAGQNIQSITVPEMQRRTVAHHPLPIAGVEIDRGVKCRRPVLHGGVIMRMGNGDSEDSAQRLNQR